MDRHIARTIVRNSAGDARVIWSIFSGYHPQELRESGGHINFQIFWKKVIIDKKNQQQMQSKVHPQQSTEWCNQGMVVGEKEKVIISRLFSFGPCPAGNVPGLVPAWLPLAVKWLKAHLALTDRLTRNFSCYWIKDSIF